MESDVSIQESPEQEKKRIVKRKRKSFVWQHFIEEETESSTEKILRCKVEGCINPLIKTNISNYSTNPMINHLKNVHQMFPSENSEKKVKTQEKQISKSDQDRFDSLLYIIY